MGYISGMDMRIASQLVETLPPAPAVGIREGADTVAMFTQMVDAPVEAGVTGYDPTLSEDFRRNMPALGPSGPEEEFDTDTALTHQSATVSDDNTPDYPEAPSATELDCSIIGSNRILRRRSVDANRPEHVADLAQEVRPVAVLGQPAQLNTVSTDDAVTNMQSVPSLPDSPATPEGARQKSGIDIVVGGEDVAIGSPPDVATGTIASPAHSLSHAMPILPTHGSNDATIHGKPPSLPPPTPKDILLHRPFAEAQISEAPFSHSHGTQGVGSNFTQSARRQVVSIPTESRWPGLAPVLEAEPSTERHDILTSAKDLAQRSRQLLSLRAVESAETKTLPSGEHRPEVVTARGKANQEINPVSEPRRTYVAVARSVSLATSYQLPPDSPAVVASAPAPAWVNKAESGKASFVFVEFPQPEPNALMPQIDGRMTERPSGRFSTAEGPRLGADIPRHPPEATSATKSPRIPTNPALAATERRPSSLPMQILTDPEGKMKTEESDSAAGSQLATITWSPNTNARVTSDAVRQVAEAIVRTDSASGRTELSLSPEELGKVQFSIRNTDGQLTVLISAERPETIALLRRHAELLSNELSQIGNGNVALDFGPGHEGSGRDHLPKQAPRDEPSTRTATRAETISGETMRRRIPASGEPGRIDVRM